MPLPYIYHSDAFVEKSLAASFSSSKVNTKSKPEPSKSTSTPSESSPKATTKRLNKFFSKMSSTSSSSLHKTSVDIDVKSLGSSDASSILPRYSQPASSSKDDKKDKKWWKKFSTDEEFVRSAHKTGAMKMNF
ncbi:hypothetical protein K402DRAFT_464473 [Aulographum hederae CBS 113979]|uniref:Uncharacterized protein n=1 Tax=Aulographum hederae CBS 113979 TaxID=1176131 RepID=A0A6G1GXE2_9PEZI|nr:hypothetical protein K402DRAFT_464473 [Aulographum hederae CBS 113979]